MVACPSGKAAWPYLTPHRPVGSSDAIYVALLRRRIQIAAAAKIADGTQIQTSSLARTRAPHSLKNARTLIGET